jgi:hypothetical protein
MRSRIVIVLFFATVVFIHLKPITDPDLFWHLATGRWIAEHGQLPDADPFNYTTSVTAYEKPSLAGVVSRQYWLANLLQYGAATVMGYAGLLLLRSMFALLTMLMAYMSARRKGLSVVASLLLIVPLGYVVASFEGDRPNQMTFFFLAAFLFLVEHLKKGSGGESRFPVGYFLPLLMLFWANMHGGFIFGAAIAGVYLAAELLRAPFFGWHAINRKLAAVLALTIVAGFFNPNGYTIISSLIQESSPFQKSSITEFMSPFTFIGYGTYSYAIELFSFVSLACISVVMCVVAGRKPLLPSLARQAESVVLILFFGFIACTAVRFIPLLAIALTPIIGAMVSTYSDTAARTFSRFMIPEAALACFLAFGAWSAYPLTVLRKPLVSDFFPEQAATFLKDNQLQGRLFNFYDWGGFLIWRFYPDKVVFVDGRGLSQRSLFQYYSVIGADRSKIAGVPVYKAVLDAYSVQTILVPGTERNGGLVPLIAVLENDPEWRLVFTFKNCLLYTRETSLKDFPKIAAYAIARESAYASLGDDPRPYLAIARTNLGLGRWGDATNFLAGALEKKPSLRGGPVEKALELVRAGKDILREDTGLP